MKNLLYILVYLFVINDGLAQSDSLIKSIIVRKDTSLSKNESSLEIHFISEPGLSKNTDLGICVNSDTFCYKMDSLATFKKAFKNGKYNVHVVSKWFEAINLGTIRFKSRTKTIAEIKLKARSIELPGIYYDLGKPVIYLYPEEKKQVSVSLNFGGKIKFTYPEYKNGWKVTAHPDGLLETGDKKYEYLFWDGELVSETQYFDITEGFIVEPDSLIDFFETTLSQAGLNEREQQDFITYWCPRMIAYPKLYIHFLFNDEYDKVVGLNVEPKPESMLRLLMLWSEAPKEKVIIKEQEIPAFKRKGYTLIDWGGSELKNIFNKPN